MTAPRLRPEAWWLIVAAALVALAALWAGTTVVTAWQRAADRVHDIEPRHARLAGIEQAGGLFEREGASVEASLARFVHPAQVDASQTGNAALQQVRDLARASGLGVTTSQAGSPEDAEGFDRIAIGLQVEGDWPQLVAMLAALADQRPAIYYSTIQLAGQRTGGEGVAQPVQAQLGLYVLREREP